MCVCLSGLPLGFYMPKLAFYPWQISNALTTPAPAGSPMAFVIMPGLSTPTPGGRASLALVISLFSRQIIQVEILSSLLGGL